MGVEFVEELVEVRGGEAVVEEEILDHEDTSAPLFTASHHPELLVLKLKLEGGEGD